MSCQIHNAGWEKVICTASSGQIHNFLQVSQIFDLLLLHVSDDLLNFRKRWLAHTIMIYGEVIIVNIIGIYAEVLALDYV